MSSLVSPGVLYVVALPIGDPDDITLRALKVLGAVDAVLCEDTRRTRTLFRHLDLDPPLHRFDAHVEGPKLDGVIARLRDGQSLALVSDAGTPAISDPGHRLVRAVWEAGLRAVPVPGPSSVTAALSVAGTGADGFTFHGFLTKGANARQTRLAALPEGAHVFFVPARDLRAFVVDVAATPGMSRLLVARELTKLHESFYVGTPAEVLEALDAHPESALGEVVIVLDAAPPAADDDALSRALSERLDEGMTPRDAARLVAERFSVSRRHVYQLALSLPRRP